ncbi:hypothetical protein ACIPPJ_23795 [Streptomyces sp. NPDC086091]|uniref:hypothetical protein n=1 Tax=Streptomyces sp. NPDC086091 TaxID=3365751 RepID=UPI003830BD48
MPKSSSNRTVPARSVKVTRSYTWDSVAPLRSPMLPVVRRASVVVSTTVPSTVVVKVGPSIRTAKSIHSPVATANGSRTSVRTV